MDTRDNDGSSSSSSGQGSGDLSDYKKLLDDNIRRNEMSLRSFGCDPADYRSSLSSSGSNSGDFNYYATLREHNIRRNEMLLSHLGFASADNGRSGSSSGLPPPIMEDVQRRFCFLFFEFQLILILNLMV